MYDTIRLFPPSQERVDRLLSALGIREKGYALATIHRPANTDHSQVLSEIVTALAQIGQRVVFPLHPRTRDKLIEFGITAAGANDLGSLRFVDPVGYEDMLALEQSASVIVTDSGGVQKEAYLLGVPCVTVRAETEWLETLNDGWNVLVGHDGLSIAAAVRERADWRKPPAPPCFGDGYAAQRIAKYLIGH
jgi:UDP-N-acetylglucosamine 2-epimerase